jgi:hypothetical protein
MRCKAFALACAFALAVAAVPAIADQQSPSPRVEKQKPSPKDMEDLRNLPDANTGTVPLMSATGPKAVFRSGCILFPGHQVRFSFFAGFPFLNRFTVQPTTFFDVAMRVRLAGFLPVTRDQFFAPGAERYNFFSPTPFRRVTVTILGAFPGPLTGCWRFSARP